VDDAAPQLAIIISSCAPRRARHRLCRLDYDNQLGAAHLSRLVTPLKARAPARKTERNETRQERRRRTGKETGRSASRFDHVGISAGKLWNRVHRREDELRLATDLRRICHVVLVPRGLTHRRARGGRGEKGEPADE